MDEATARAMIADHFATAASDQKASAAIYAEDAVLEFPQGAERIRGKANIIAFRSAYPAALEFTIDRTVGCGDLWVNEYRLSYDDGEPYRVVGIMEFASGRVVRERIYLGQAWEPPPWRAKWVEPIETEPAPDRDRPERC